MRVSLFVHIVTGQRHIVHHVRSVVGIVQRIDTLPFGYTFTAFSRVAVTPHATALHPGGAQSRPNRQQQSGQSLRADTSAPADPGTQSQAQLRLLLHRLPCGIPYTPRVTGNVINAQPSLNNN